MEERLWEHLSVQGYVFPSILDFWEELVYAWFWGGDILGGNKQLESTGVLLDI